jgi:hypothetical protein
MEDFFDPMTPEELEAIRQMSDAPTLLFMFIMAFIFIISMLIDDNRRYGH